jgi:3',5'-cyclic AMP phosphodiesterase CpdA
MARALALLLATLSGCFEYSPHELPDDDAGRDLHRKAIAALEARPPPQPLRFAVVGDTQREFDATVDAVASLNGRDDLAFVVQLGDLTDMGLTFEFEVMNRVLSRLRVPYFVVAGNHDVIGNGHTIYEHMFGPLDLAFTHGRVRFVLLNTNGLEFATPVPDLDWLAAQLAPDEAHDRSVVLAHVEPEASEFRPELREEYLAILREDGPALSVHAHAHRYEVREVDGVTVVLADDVGGRSYLVVTAAEGGGFEIERVFF